MGVSKRVAISIIVAVSIIVIICVVVPLLIFYLKHDNKSDYDRALQVARSDFGCKKVLWINRATYGNAFTGGLKYYNPENEDDGASITDSALSPTGGYYVIGEDSDGNNVYVIVPSDNNRKPIKFEWKFDYTFNEILDFIGRFDYKFVDGIDDAEQEYRHDSERLKILDIQSSIEYRLRLLREDFCERLDVMAVFTFRQKIDNDLFYDYYVVQEGGELKIYRCANNSTDEFETYVYTHG